MQMFSPGFISSSNKLSQLDWTVKSTWYSVITETFRTLTTDLSNKAAVDYFGGIRDIIMPKFVECISTLYCRQRTNMLQDLYFFPRRQPIIMLRMKKLIPRAHRGVFREEGFLFSTRLLGNTVQIQSKKGKQHQVEPLQRGKPILSSPASFCATLPPCFPPLPCRQDIKRSCIQGTENNRSTAVFRDLLLHSLIHI